MFSSYLLFIIIAENMFVKRFPLIFPYKNVIFRLALQRTSRYTGSMLISKYFNLIFSEKRGCHALQTKKGIAKNRLTVSEGQREIGIPH